MKTPTRLLVLCLVLWTLHCHALMVLSEGQNNAPTGDFGLKTQVIWTEMQNMPSTASTIIGPHYVVSDEHDNRPVGSTFTHMGTNSIIVSNLLAPSGTFRVYAVTNSLPADCWYPVFTGNPVGKTIYVHGVGNPIGEMVTTIVPVEITNFVHEESLNSFNATGLGQFKIMRSIDLINWAVMTNIYTAPTSVSLPCTGESQMFYKLLVTSPVVFTNGYKPGPSDGILREGMMLIGDTGSNGLIATNFNPSVGSNTCAIWSNDSSGGTFTKVNNKIYFVGPVHGSNSVKPWKKGANGNPFFAAMRDLSGITSGNYTYPLVGGPFPTESYITQVNNASDAMWLKNFMGK